MSNSSATFTVFNDGSTDGTRSALSSLSFAVTVLNGDGSAFWAKSMSEAERAVLNANVANGASYIVWLNDDVVLDHSSLERMIALTQINPGAVLVGAMREPHSAEVSYSGLRRSGLHPLRFVLVKPTDVVERIDTFNGNFVLVPDAVARSIGGIDGSFVHALADIDYGLRCGRKGVPLLLAPGSFGECARNPARHQTSLSSDWRFFIGPKGGGNYPSMKRIMKRSNRFTWPIFVFSTYTLWWMRRLSNVGDQVSCWARARKQ